MKLKEPDGGQLLSSAVTGISAVTGDLRMSSAPTRNALARSLCSDISNCQIQGFVFYLDNDKRLLN